MSTTTTKREALTPLEAFIEVGRIARPIRAVADGIDEYRHREEEIVEDVAHLTTRGLKDLIELQEGKTFDPDELELRLIEASSMLAAVNALAQVLKNFDRLANDNTAPLMDRKEYEAAMIGLTGDFAWQFSDDPDAVAKWMGTTGAELEVAP